MKRAALLVAAFLLVPAAAHADAGSAIMIATMGHLLVINLVISLVEALVVSWRYKRPMKVAMPAALAANYLSFFIGFIGVMAVGHAALNVMPGATPLDQARNLLAAMWLLSFAASVVVEWPSYAYVVRDAPRKWKVGFRASLLAQTASYALLLPYYFGMSSIGALTIERPRDLSFVKPPIAWVYYIGKDDGAVWWVRTDGTRRAKVLDTHVTDTSSRLAAVAGDPGAPCDLYLVTTDPHADREQTTVLLPRFASHAGVDRQRPRSTWWSFGDAADMRPDAEKASPSVFTEFWATGGLRVRYGNYYTGYDVGLDTPFVSSLCRNATVLPNDFVVFQMDDMILILDTHARKLGLLARGRGPVVALDEPAR